MTPSLVKTVPQLPPRQASSHKGDFGRVLVVAGSLGMSGAAGLAGKAALRSGAGLVRIAAPAGVVPVIASYEPAYTTIPLPQDKNGKIGANALPILLKAVKSCEVIALGPGLSTSRTLRSIVEKLIALEGQRIVIDADGLNNLARCANWQEKTKAELVLTPHPGEMKRLWASVFRHALPQERSDLALEFSQQTRTTLVLKGAQSVVTNGKSLYINSTGNPGMATGGSGDVLTGVIAALMAQGLSNLDAAILGTHVHGLAGDIASQSVGQVSLIATDLINALPQAFQAKSQQAGTPCKAG
jgi:ADP-dependent NAD(P)H-hydrate dehydratase